MTPVAADPDGVGTGRSCPAAGRPNIAGSIPAVIAADPDPASVGARAGVLHDNGWWADANINMLSEGRRQAEESSCSNKEKLLHTRGFFLSH
jgi:hypothetical protein